MSTSETAGAAFDASANVSEPQNNASREAKLASGVDFLEQQLTVAQETVNRMDDKVSKLEDHLEGAKQALEEAKEAEENLQGELDDLRRELEDRVDAEVDQ